MDSQALREGMSAVRKNKERLATPDKLKPVFETLQVLDIKLDNTSPDQVNSQLAEIGTSIQDILHHNGIKNVSDVQFLSYYENNKSEVGGKVRKNKKTRKTRKVRKTRKSKRKN
jgi:hypothetical protein